MNEFTKKEKRKERLEKRERTEAKPWVFPMMMWGGVLLAMIFSAHAARVYFNDKKEKLENEARQIRLQTEQTKREIRNLTAMRERMYSLRYIKERIRKYNLALRPTEPEQIRYLKYYDSAPSEKGRAQDYSMASAETGGTGRYQASVRH